MTTPKQIAGYLKARRDQTRSTLGGISFNDGYNVPTYGITQADYYAIDRSMNDAYGMMTSSNLTSAGVKKALRDHPISTKGSSTHHATKISNGSNGKKTGAQLDREVNDILSARQKRDARTASPAPRVVGMASPSEYERRERQEAQQRLTEVERAPLADRKEAAAEFLAAMRDDPELVAERVGWLLNGSYGYGQQLRAKQILGSPRMNRSAALTHLTAAYEWSTPSALAMAAWKKLTKAQQVALEKAVQVVIRDADRAAGPAGPEGHATMRETRYVVTVPPTRDVGSYTTRVRGPVANARRDALWDYNSARRHDGLPPVDRMPSGTKYTKEG